MEDPRIKRLLWMAGISIIVILLLKAVLLNTATKVSKAHERMLSGKSHQTAPASVAQPEWSPQPEVAPEPPPAPPDPIEPTVYDMPAASGVEPYTP